QSSTPVFQNTDCLGGRGPKLSRIQVLSILPYTVVLPANAITFIWALLLAKWMFHESIGGYKVVGIIFIIVGVIVLLV
ncbi:hypothetical protein WIW51_23030, partial [Paenibacillus sp. PL2-23]